MKLDIWVHKKINSALEGAGLKKKLILLWIVSCEKNVQRHLPKFNFKPPEISTVTLHSLFILLSSKIIIAIHTQFLSKSLQNRSEPPPTTVNSHFLYFIAQWLYSPIIPKCYLFLSIVRLFFPMIFFLLHDMGSLS